MTITDLPPIVIALAIGLPSSALIYWSAYSIGRRAGVAAERKRWRAAYPEETPTSLESRAHAEASRRHIRGY